MAVVAGSKRLDQYDVGVYMVGENDEVVALPGADGEPAHVVSVELDDQLCSDEEFLCLGDLFSWNRVKVRSGLGLRRPDALPGLGEVPLD